MSELCPNCGVIDYEDECGFCKISEKNAKLKKQNEVLMETVEFYANGGNSNFDIWYDEKLGYYTGKRAKEALEKIKQLEREI